MASTLSVGIGNCEASYRKLLSRICVGSIGKNGKKNDGGGHAEHIAEIGAGTHQQIFHHIAERAAAFQDARVQASPGCAGAG